MKNLRINPSQSNAGLIVSVLAGAALVGPAQAQDAKPPEPPKGWETSASAGLTLSRGNSKNFLATMGIDTKRKWAKDEVLLGASAGYGKATVRSDTAPDQESKTDAYIKGAGSYNHLFTERFYGGIRLDALHD